MNWIRIGFKEVQTQIYTKKRNRFQLYIQESFSISPKIESWNGDCSIPGSTPMNTSKRGINLNFWIRYRRQGKRDALDALGFHPHVLDMSDDKMIEPLSTHLQSLYIVIHGLGPLIELSSKHIQLPRGSQINPLSSTSL